MYITQTKAPFTPANIMKCQCTKCPVQANSLCVKGKIGVLKEAMMKSPLQREDIPGMYCSTGQAVCKDTDYSKMCACTTCPIWSEYKLDSGKPAGYFCRDGKAM